VPNPECEELFIYSPYVFLRQDANKCAVFFPPRNSENSPAQGGPPDRPPTTLLRG